MSAAAMRCVPNRAEQVADPARRAVRRYRSGPLTGRDRARVSRNRYPGTTECGDRCGYDGSLTVSAQAWFETPGQPCGSLDCARDDNARDDERARRVEGS